jgi:TetR/AcrR family transcriptional regulator, transcriptional repressor for nem operon
MWDREIVRLRLTVRQSVNNIPTSRYLIMPRPPCPETRTKLLDAAEELMLAQGYTATSVEEICDAAGLTKGSFFHYFDSKHDLGVAAVQRFYDRNRAMFRDAPFRRLSDPRARVLSYLDFVSEFSRQPAAARGCLVGTVAQELAVSDKEMRAVCAWCFTDWADVLKADLELAKKQHAPRARWKPQTMANHIVAVIQGSLILAKSSQDPSGMAENLAHLKRYVTLLFEESR